MFIYLANVHAIHLFFVINPAIRVVSDLLLFLFGENFDNQQ